MPHVENPRRNADGTWSTRARYRLGGAGTPLLSEPILGYPSRSACIEAATHWSNDFDRRRWLGELAPAKQGAEMLVTEAIEAWVSDHVLEDLKRGTQDNYIGLLPIYMTPFFEGRKLKEVTPALGREWRKWVKAEAAARSDDAAGGIPTTNRIIQLGKGIFTFCVENQWCDENPLAPLKIYPYKQEARKRKFAPSPEQTEAIRSVISIDRVDTYCEWVRDRDRLIVTLIGCEGLDQSEIYNAYWWQLIDERGALRSSFIVPDGKTSSRERDVRLWPTVREEIRAFYELRGRPALDSLVVPGIRGAKLSHHNWRADTWLAALEAAREIPGYEQLPHFGAHRLRAGAASMLGYALTPTQVALAFLGHDQFTTTVRFYLRAFNEAEDRSDERHGMPVEEQIRQARARFDESDPATA